MVSCLPVGQILRMLRITDKKYYFAFELAVDGELFGCLSQRNHFSKRDARTVLWYVRSFLTH